MTVERAKAILKEQYPAMDQVMRARIVNLFEQIEDAKAKPCKTFQMRVVEPVSVRFRRYQEHKEDIPF